MNLYQNYTKALIDIFISFFALIFLLPIFLVLIIILYFSNEGAGVFFYQERPGKYGKIFKVVKFKTMNDKIDANGELLPSFQRITPIGSFVRKYSLDELPQLWNVLRGDMSLIGPRPLLIQYLPLYSERQKLRHHVKPGITGWAQVNGRNTISWQKKFELDIYYVQNLSFILDVKILFLTFKKVINGSDINTSKTQVVETFNGNN